MPSLSSLRSLFPNLVGVDDQTVIGLYAKDYGLDPKAAAAELGWKPPTFAGEFKSAVPRGLGQTVQGAGQVLDDFGWDNNPVLRYGTGVVERNPSRINSLSDIADYPLAALGSATGNAATFLGTGGALGIAGKGLALAGAARAGGLVAGGVGQTANMALPSYGGIREQQLRDGNDSPVDMLAAAGGALTSGYIEQRFGLNKMFGLSSAPKTALRAEIGSMASTPLRTGLKEWGKAGVVEGLEELAQNPIEQIAAYKDPTTGENIQETLFGGAMGVLGGLGLGGYGGVRQGMRQANLRNDLRQDMFIAPDAGTPTDLLQGMDRREQYNQVQGAWQAQKDFDRPAPMQQPDEETAAYLEQRQQAAETETAKQTLRDNLVSKGVDPAKIEGIVLAAFQPKRTKAAATYTEEQQAIYESLPDTMTDKQKRRIVGKPGVVPVPSVSKVGKVEAMVMKEFDDAIAAGLVTPNEESTLRGYWDASEKKQGDAWKLRANINALIKAKQGAKNGDGSQSVLPRGTPTDQTKNVLGGQAPSGGAQTAQAVSGAQGQEVNDDPARALGLKLLADMPVGKKNRQGKTEPVKFGPVLATFLGFDGQDDERFQAVADAHGYASRQRAEQIVKEAIPMLREVAARNGITVEQAIAAVQALAASRRTDLGMTEDQQEIAKLTGATEQAVESPYQGTMDFTDAASQGMLSSALRAQTDSGATQIGEGSDETTSGAPGKGTVAALKAEQEVDAATTVETAPGETRIKANKEKGEQYLTDTEIKAKRAAEALAKKDAKGGTLAVPEERGQQGKVKYKHKDTEYELAHEDYNDVAHKWAKDDNKIVTLWEDLPQEYQDRITQAWKDAMNPRINPPFQGRVSFEKMIDQFSDVEQEYINEKTKSDKQDARQGAEAETESKVQDDNAGVPKQEVATKSVAAPKGQVQEVTGGIRSKFEDFLGVVIKRFAMEQEGQANLDEMVESNIKPQDVAKEFWANTFFDLPASAQQRFTQMLKANTGMEPGSTTTVNSATGTSVVAQNWQDVADMIDVGDTAENLEGTERGFVALMYEANKRANAFKAENKAEFTALESSSTKVERKSTEVKTRYPVIFEGKPATLTIIRKVADPSKISGVTIKVEGERFAFVNLGGQGVVTDAKMLENMRDTEIIDAEEPPTKIERKAPVPLPSAEPPKAEAAKATSVAKVEPRTFAALAKASEKAQALVDTRISQLEGQGVSFEEQQSDPELSSLYEARIAIDESAAKKGYLGAKEIAARILGGLPQKNTHVTIDSILRETYSLTASPSGVSAMAQYTGRAIDNPDTVSQLTRDISRLILARDYPNADYNAFIGSGGSALPAEGRARLVSEARSKAEALNSEIRAFFAGKAPKPLPSAEPPKATQAKATSVARTANAAKPKSLTKEQKAAAGKVLLIQRMEVAWNDLAGENNLPVWSALNQDQRTRLMEDATPNSEGNAVRDVVAELTGETQEAPASTVPALELPAIDVDFIDVTDEEVAKATNLLPQLETALDKTLDESDKQEVTDHFGVEEEFGNATKKLFLKEYAKWLTSTNRALHELADIFVKVAKAAVNSVLAIAVAMSFSPAQIKNAQAAYIPVSEVTFTKTIKHPTADFKGAEASLDARLVADWRTRLGNDKKFMLADKVGGLIYAFDAKGVLIAKTPALFGLTPGDFDNKPVNELMGKDYLNSLKAEHRVTPAGVFSASASMGGAYGAPAIDFKTYRGKNLSLAVHTIVLTHQEQKRAERMASATPKDNRITSGCINTPNEFAENIIGPNFSIDDDFDVIVLPETLTAEEFFHDMGERETTVTTMRTIGGKQDSAKEVSWGSDKYGRPEQSKASRSRARVTMDGSFLEPNDDVQHKDGRVGRVVSTRYRNEKIDSLNTITVKFADGTTEGVTPDKLTYLRKASVKFDGRKGTFGNESVNGGLRKIAKDDDIALEFDDRVGAVMVTGIDRISGGMSGRASNALKSLTDWADSTNNTLVLMPSASGALKKDDLKAWYARNGFVSAPDGAMVRKASKGASYLDDKKYFYHAVRNDADIDSIVKNGLRAGTNVSSLGGQAFEDEGGTVLVFERSGARLAGKGYQGDEVVQSSGVKPVAILKDTSVDINTVDEEAYNKLGDQYDALEKRAESYAKTLGITVDQFWEKVVRKQTDELGNLGDQAKAMGREQDKIFRQMDEYERRSEKGNVTEQDVLSKYEKHGLPVQKLTPQKIDNTQKQGTLFSKNTKGPIVNVNEKTGMVEILLNGEVTYEQQFAKPALLANFKGDTLDRMIAERSSEVENSDAFKKRFQLTRDMWMETQPLNDYELRLVAINKAASGYEYGDTLASTVIANKDGGTINNIRDSLNPSSRRYDAEAAGESDTSTRGRSQAQIAKDIIAAGKQWYRNGELISEQEYSKGASAKGSTVAELTTLLKGYFHAPAFFNRMVEVVQSSKDLPAAVRNDPEFDDTVKAVVHNGKAYIIADKVPANKALSILLHEVGVHLGMQKLLGGNYTRLIAQLKKWESKPGSLEHDLVKKARARVNAAGTSALDQDHELVAYFVEEAVNAGINPTDLAKSKGPIAEWIASLMKTLMSALKSVGMKNLDKLTAQNIVDLAYGAANIQLSSATQPSTKKSNLYSFAGVNANQSDKTKSSYVQAVLMDANGESAKNIYNDTGWFKWDDGKWRFEISDKDMTLRSGAFIKLANSEINKTSVSLQELITHKKLFDAYPKMQEIKVRLDKTMPVGGANINPERTLITLSYDELRPMFMGNPNSYTGAKRIAEILSTLVHEIQHAIQTEEGFSGGGNSGNPEQLVHSKVATERLLRRITEDAEVVPSYKEWASRLQYVVDHYEESRDAVRRFMKTSSDSTSTATLMKELFGDSKTSVRELFRIYSDIMEFRYINLAGEVEARDVSNRMKYPNSIRQPALMDDELYIPTTPNFPSLKFSKGNASTIPKAVEFTNDTVANMLSRVKVTAADLGSKALNAAVFMNDLIKIAEKAGLTAAKGFNDLMGERDQIRNRGEERISAIMSRASKLKDQSAVEQFLRDSTIDKKYGYGPKSDNGEYARRFTQLSAEGQAVVKDVFQVGEDNYTEMQRLAAVEVNREYNALIARFPKKTAELEKERTKELARLVRVMPKLDGPYAPLKRFGDHVVVARSNEYAQAEAAGDRKKMDALIASPNDNNYLVEFYDTAGAADARKAQLVSYFDKVVSSNRQENFHKVDGLPWSGIEKIKSAVEDSPDAKYKESMNRLLTNLYLKMLAESSARKSELKRRGVLGSGDMFRAFAANGRSNAHFIASMAKNPEIGRKIADMRQESKALREGGNVDATRAMNEILARYAQGLDYKETPWVDKALRVSSLWMLLTSPAYYLQNSTQTYMMTLPVLGGRYGGKAFTEITKAYGDVMKYVGNMGAELDVRKLPITKAEQDMLISLRDKGKLDITIASDMGRWASGAADQGVVGRAIDKMYGAAGKVEALNRITTALAAYRLSNGNEQYAGEIIDMTQGNYAATNAPRFFSATGATKLITQFRKYQLIQISLMGRLMYDSFKGASAQEKAFARRSLLWLFAQQGLLTGLKGLPIPAVIYMIAAALGGDDDDDWERNLRKWIGDEDIATLLIRGIPAYMGLDLSGRIGMGNAFSILPYSDIDFSKKGYKEAVFGATGAFIGGMGGQLFDGLEKMRKGNYYKGLEALAPRGLRDAMAGYRMGTEGVTSGKGDLLLSADEITAFDAAMKAVGLPTTRITEFQTSRGDLFELNNHFKERETALKNDYADAAKQRDSDAMSEAREEWKAIQASKGRWLAYLAGRGLGNKDLTKDLQPHPLGTLLKAPAAQMKRERPWQGAAAQRQAQ